MQISLFDAGEPAIARRRPVGRREWLADGAWVEHEPQWLDGHAALMDRLRRETRWHHERRPMYGRVVDVPRLTAAAPTEGPAGRLIGDMAAALSRRYATRLERVSLAYYRDGRDSVAPHGDKLGARAHDAVVAIVSLGAPRRFTLRRVAGTERRAYVLGWGALLAMGGSCQRTWLHAVPKVAHAEPRISIVFRPA